MTHSDDVRKFLSSRRSRITPEEAGLPAYGGNRRVKGLRREEVAMLAGMSIEPVKLFVYVGWNSYRFRWGSIRSG